MTSPYFDEHRASLNAFYATVEAAGVLANIVVLTSVARAKIASRLTKFLLCTQATYDMAVCIFSTILFLDDGIGFAIHKVNAAICHLWYSQFLFWLAVTLSTYNIVFLAFDRLWAVIFSPTYKANFRRYLFTSNTTTILATIVLCLPGLASVCSRNGDCIPITKLAPNEMTNFQRMLQPYLTKYNPIIWFCFIYLLPSILLVSISGCVLYSLYRRGLLKNMSCAMRQQTDQTVENQSGLVKVVPSIMLTTLAYSTGLLIFQAYDSFSYVLSSAGIVDYPLGSPKQLLCIFLLTMNCVLNPVVTFSAIVELRRSFVSNVKRLVSLCEPSDKESSREAE